MSTAAKDLLFIVFAGGCGLIAQKYLFRDGDDD